MALLGEILAFILGFYLGCKFHPRRETQKTK